jgi:hypothetical protein
VAPVAQAEGVNSHQVFQWRAYGQRTVGDAKSGCAALLPVVVSGGESDRRAFDAESALAAASGAIHTELPGCATITAEHGVATGLVRVTAGGVAVVELCTGTEIWIRY